MKTKQSIFIPQLHTAWQVPCVKMCEYIRKVLKARVRVYVNNFTLCKRLILITFNAFLFSLGVDYA